MTTTTMTSRRRLALALSIRPCRQTCRLKLKASELCRPRLALRARPTGACHNHPQSRVPKRMPRLCEYMAISTVLRRLQAQVLHRGRQQRRRRLIQTALVPSTPAALRCCSGESNRTQTSKPVRRSSLRRRLIRRRRPSTRPSLRFQVCSVALQFSSYLHFKSSADPWPRTFVQIKRHQSSHRRALLRQSGHEFMRP